MTPEEEEYALHMLSIREMQQEMERISGIYDVILSRMINPVWIIPSPCDPDLEMDIGL